MRSNCEQEKEHGKSDTYIQQQQQQQHQFLEYNLKLVKIGTALAIIS